MILRKQNQDCRETLSLAKSHSEHCQSKLALKDIQAKKFEQVGMEIICHEIPSKFHQIHDLLKADVSTTVDDAKSNDK